MNKSIRKILVTGSNGTIGTRLCEKLLKSNYKVIGVDWKKNQWNKAVDKITLQADLRDRKSFQKLPQDVDLVIHLAANARVYKLVQDPILARDNLETLFNAIDFTRKNKIKNFIFASSREVYGNSDRQVYSEDEAFVKNCESPYTASKIAGEAMVHAYHQCYGLSFVIFRFSNVYGMYDVSDRVIPLFIRLTKENKDLVIFGNEKLLDFTYIDDCVSGIIKTVKRFDQVKNDVFNLASGVGTPITKIAQLIQSQMQSKNKITIKGSRTGEVIKFIADITKAKNKLDFKPRVSIEVGIKKSIAWYENQP